MSCSFFMVVFKNRCKDTTLKTQSQEGVAFFFIFRPLDLHFSSFFRISSCICLTTLSISLGCTSYKPNLNIIIFSIGSLISVALCAKIESKSAVIVNVILYGVFVEHSTISFKNAGKLHFHAKSLIA